ncbi:MAG TPA: PQQ-binding-like beta-propeller repeat protein [Pirellulales bacterium]|nr:PQQ-binding-like beta-propeller repeat protein [Pirellulales bacterium]
MLKTLLHSIPSLVRRGRCHLLLAASLAAAVPRPAAAENWPQWRGPRGDGTSREQDLPLAWSERHGLAWKVELPEWGTSTPAIWGDAIFVTTQHDDQLLLLRLARDDGALVWTREVGRADTPRQGPPRGAQKFHELHNNASPSPVTDGELVVVHFGNGVLAAYDFDGEPLWKHDLQEEYGKYSIWWGHANSPILYENLVISVCMQDSLAGVADRPAPSYLLAHDKRTGREKWKSQRMTGANAEEGDAYTTPVLYRIADRWELAVMGGNQLDAYDPATGKQLWFLPGIIGGRTITGPTAGHGLVFATQGMRKDLLAVKAGGKGKLTRRDVAWKDADATPDTCCPVLWNDLLFTINDDGVAKCYDVETGHPKWKKRLSGNYKASPLAAEGRIYFMNLAGLTTVVAAGDRYEKLAENPLDDATTASPAVSGGRIYIRGRKHLYAIEKK